MCDFNFKHFHHGAGKWRESALPVTYLKLHSAFITTFTEYVHIVYNYVLVFCV